MFEQPKPPRIKMNFRPGKVTATVSGVPGPACRAFSKPFMEAVGGQVVSDAPTAEMAQVATGSISTQVKVEE